MRAWEILKRLPLEKSTLLQNIKGKRSLRGSWKLCTRDDDDETLIMRDNENVKETERLSYRDNQTKAVPEAKIFNRNKWSKFSPEFWDQEFFLASLLRTILSYSNQWNVWQNSMHDYDSGFSQYYIAGWEKADEQLFKACIFMKETQILLFR